MSSAGITIPRTESQKVVIVNSHSSTGSTSSSTASSPELLATPAHALMASNPTIVPASTSPNGITALGSLEGTDEKEIVIDRTVCAAVIVNKRNKNEVLMVTSRKHDTKWIFPKGGLEAGETLLEAAIRESYEEAGTPATLVDPEAREVFCAYSRSGDGERIVQYHIFELMVDPSELVDTWPEDAERRRAWVPIGEALDRCSAWRNEKQTKLELVEGFKRCRAYQDHLARVRDAQSTAAAVLP